MGAIITVVALVFSAIHYLGDFRIQSKTGYYSVPDEVSPEAGDRIQAKYGEPAIDYYSQLMGSQRKETYPYQIQLEQQKARKQSYIEQTLGMAAFGVGGGAAWVGLILLLSWLIRGFMA